MPPTQQTFELRAQALALLAACFFILTQAAALAWDGSSQAGLLTHSEALFSRCMQRCAEPTRLGALTRKGCETGCYEARRTFCLRGKRFKSYKQCSDALDKLELDRDLIIAEHQDWCVRNLSHLHHRKGCKDAMELFYKTASKDLLCLGKTSGAGVTIPLAPPAAPAPLLRDTPKYQKAAPKKMSAKQKSINEKRAKNTAKQKSALPGQAPLAPGLKTPLAEEQTVPNAKTGLTPTKEADKNNVGPQKNRPSPQAQMIVPPKHIQPGSQTASTMPAELARKQITETEPKTISPIQNMPDQTLAPLSRQDNSLTNATSPQIKPVPFADKTVRQTSPDASKALSPDLNPADRKGTINDRPEEAQQAQNAETHKNDAGQTQSQNSLEKPQGFIPPVSVLAEPGPAADGEKRLKPSGATQSVDKDPGSAAAAQTAPPDKKAAQDHGSELPALLPPIQEKL